MDEILASIRRIIESNDPVPQPGVASDMAEPEGFMGRPANDDSEEVTLTVDDAFADRDADYGKPEAPISAPSPMSAHPLRMEPTSLVRNVQQVHHEEPVRHMEPARHIEPLRNVEAAPAQQKSLSLADVAARVRAASERGVIERNAALAQASARPVVAETVVAAPQAAVVVPEPMREAEIPAPAREVQTVEAVDEINHPAGDSEQVSQLVSLLSSSAGDQVARSFQDLAIAVDHAERRSLDQIAEEMLRPMLQEWLDDNLPTLVERLVREEIERVARGSRR
jgi:cell pole-organizing protein PopZ